LSQLDVLLLAQLSGRSQFPAALGQQRCRVFTIIVHQPQKLQCRVQPDMIVLVDERRDQRLGLREILQGELRGQRARGSRRGRRLAGRNRK